MINSLKYFLFFISLLLCQSNSFGQQNKLDSLLAIIKTSTDDTLKVNAQNELFLVYEFSDELKATEYLNNALALSQKINYKKGTGKTYLYFGYYAEDKGNFNDALKNYFSSLKIEEELNDKKAIADTYMNIGSAYYNLGNYPEALKSHFNSLKIKEKINDKKGIAYSLTHIGNVYNNQGNYSEALKNHLAALKINIELNDKRGMGSSFNNIGISYYNQKNYTKALENHFESLKIKEERGDQKGVATSYNNIGIIYFSLGNYTEALKNHFTSLKIKEEIGDSKGIASSLINIGQIFLKQEKYDKAKEYLTKGKESFLAMGSKDELKETFRDLTVIDSAKGNYKGAYENHIQYILYRDSIDNEETRKKTIQNQMTYDFEKKEAIATAEHKKELENQEAIADEKSRKQKLVILFVIGGLLLVILFAGFIFRSLRITRKQKNIIEEQKNIVEIQKQEVELQKIIVEEHQKEIIDSIVYARRIQQSLLPTEKYIEKNLNRLRKTTR